MATHADIRIDVRSDPRLLKSVRGLVRAYLESCGVPARRVDDAVLAVDEACANAMRHSYNGDKNQRISLRLRPYAAGIEIVLRDQGVTAPPEAVARKPVVPPDRQTVKPGGRGIQILYEVFDEVVFRPGRIAGNQVTMRLAHPREPHPSQSGPPT